MRTRKPVRFRTTEEGLVLDLQELPMGGAFYAEGFRLIPAE